MPKKIKYSKEILELAAKNSKSIAEVLRFLNLSVKGGNFRTIKRNLIKYNIDFSHFTGQGWSKGLTKDISDSIKKYSESNTKHTKETSLINGIYLNSKTLRRLLNECKIEYKCCVCNNAGIWNNKPITLHIDHINGSNIDNRIENLRYLCPNCHSQTETFGSKNKSKKSKNEFFCQPTVSNKNYKQCLKCNKEHKNKKFCSYECAHSYQKIISTYHTDEEIFEILKNNNFNYSKTATQVGLSDNGVRKRLKKWCPQQDLNL